MWKLSELGSRDWTRSKTWQNFVFLCHIKIGLDCSNGPVCNQNMNDMVQHGFPRIFKMWTGGVSEELKSDTFILQGTTVASAKGFSHGLQQPSAAILWLYLCEQFCDGAHSLSSKFQKYPKVKKMWRPWFNILLHYSHFISALYHLICLLSTFFLVDESGTLLLCLMSMYESFGRYRKNLTNPLKNGGIRNTLSLENTSELGFTCWREL